MGGARQRSPRRSATVVSAIWGVVDDCSYGRYAGGIIATSMTAGTKPPGGTIWELMRSRLLGSFGKKPKSGATAGLLAALRECFEKSVALCRSHRRFAPLAIECDCDWITLARDFARIPGLT